MLFIIYIYIYDNINATAAKLFWDNVVCQFGLPLSIVSDQDKLFMSDLWKELMNSQGVKMKTTVPHRPQADEGRKNWDEAIKSIEFPINCAPSASTEVSPSCVVYGFEPRMQLNIHTHYNINFSEATTRFTHVPQDNMVDAQVEQAIHYNKDREDIEYEEGDLVLVKRSKLNTFKVDINDELKLLPNYCGPFKVVKKLSKLNYQIRLINRNNGTRSIHVDDIKPYIEEDRILFSKRNQDQHSQLKDEIHNPNSTTLETGDYSTFQSHVMSIILIKKSSKAELLMKSWEPSTLKVYSSSYTRFRNFCTSNSWNPANITLVVFMDYLTHLFKNRPPYRSMLNQLLLLKNQTDIVNDPFITRIITGIHKMRPSSAKYQEIWYANQFNGLIITPDVLMQYLDSEYQGKLS
ncbi:hypothetical protein ACTFIW_008722 [Dictyostelium discoideum]